MVTYKKLLEMLDSVEKTEDGKKFKSKIKNTTANVINCGTIFLTLKFINRDHKKKG